MRHCRAVMGAIRRLQTMDDDELYVFAKEIRAPIELVRQVRSPASAVPILWWLSGLSAGCSLPSHYFRREFSWQLSSQAAFPARDSVLYWLKIRAEVWNSSACSAPHFACEADACCLLVTDQAPGTAAGGELCGGRRGDARGRGTDDADGHGRRLCWQRHLQERRPRQTSARHRPGQQPAIAA